MISYSFPEERDFVLFFVERTGDEEIPGLLENNVAISKKDAEKISSFFWKAIDLAVSLNEEDCPWPEGFEFWSEKVLQSFTAFLKKSGFENALQEASLNKAKNI